jgi:cell division protein FtsW (lipid II flippase)
MDLKVGYPLPAGFNLQPAELCKIFTALFLAKFISKPETDFTKLKSQLIAGAMIALPAILSIMQHELGLALVYSAFLFAMYREGLPASYLGDWFIFCCISDCYFIIRSYCSSYYLNGDSHFNHLVYD